MKTLTIRCPEHLLSELMTGVAVQGEINEFVHARIAVAQDVILTVLDSCDRQAGSLLCAAFDQLTMAAAVLEAPRVPQKKRGAA